MVSVAMVYKERWIRYWNSVFPLTAAFDWIALTAVFFAFATIFFDDLCFTSATGAEADFVACRWIGTGDFPTAFFDTRPFFTAGGSTKEVWGVYSSGFFVDLSDFRTIFSGNKQYHQCRSVNRKSMLYIEPVVSLSCDFLAVLLIITLSLGLACMRK